MLINIRNNFFPFESVVHYQFSFWPQSSKIHKYMFYLTAFVSSFCRVFGVGFHVKLKTYRTIVHFDIS